MKEKIKNLKKKIKGPVFSIHTPFKKNGDVDYLSLKNYLKFLYERGARTFYVMVYNSRLSLLNPNEIIKLNIFCIKIVKKLSKDNVIICAEPYQCSTQQTIKYVNKYSKAGADLVSLIFGEKYYSDKQVYEHFQKVNLKSKSLLLLHQQFLENGMSADPLFRYYSIELLEKIFSLDKFIAMKEDAKKDNYTKKILKKLKGVIIIKAGGGKTAWLKAAKYNCPAWLCGIANMDPLIATDFYNYYKTKDYNNCKLLIMVFENPVNDLMKKFGWHVTIKALMEKNNLIKRYERSPLKEIDDKEVYIVERCFNKMKKQALKYFGPRYLDK